MQLLEYFFYFINSCCTVQRKMGTALISALTANIISFSSGNSLTWPSFEIGKLSNINETTLNVPLTEEEGAWVASLVSFGAIFGPFLFCWLPTRIGRKLTLLIIGLPLFLSTLLLAFSKTVELVYFARFISGVASGGLLAIVPNYLAEIADSRNRGAINSIVNMTSSGGLLFSYVVGPFVGIKLFNCILTIFPVLFFIFFFICGVESPYYYVQTSRHDLAKATLEKIRGTDANIEDELMVIQLKIKEAGSSSVLDIFKSRGLTNALIVSVCLLAFQQLCGIISVLSYTQNIFEDANVSLEPKICSILVGIVMFFSNFLIPVTVDRFGRKIVLLISAIGMLVSETVLGVYYYLKDHNIDVSAINFLPIVFLIIFIIFYSIGYASVPWIYLGEVFPTNLKSFATFIASTACYTLAFILTKYFPAMQDAFGMGVCFWIFGAACAVSIPFSQLLILETKGKTLAEIQDLLIN